MNRFNVASGRHPFPDGFFCLRRVIRGDDPNFECPRLGGRWFSRYTNEDCSSHAVNSPLTKSGFIDSV